MAFRSSPDDVVRAALAGALAGCGRVVLAISGGRDSMVLLDATARWHRELVVAVATFDHGTGAAAAAAAALVEDAGARRGLRVIRGRAPSGLRGEAAWREARWSFLRRVAADERGTVVTAHTRDDQVETVLMRVLRGSGARGLAALYAESAVLRPLLELERRDIRRYAASRRIRWEEDPSNRSRAHLRNRVRLDVLPALVRVRPELPGELLAIARRAATLRREVDALVARAVPIERDRGELRVAREHLQRYDAHALALLWPAIAARLGITLDRRGTQRLTSFTINGRQGSRIQLSGGFEAVLHRGVIGLRRSASSVPRVETQTLSDDVVIDGWSFRRTRHVAPRDMWGAALPVDRPLTVRAWQPGDRMIPHGTAAPRRVKGLLRDAGIDAARRVRWPVVVAGDEIVWIPGVRRSRAATGRSGRPVVLYSCERIDG
jgi:tRNA(Ile)-lysidine synthase